MNFATSVAKLREWHIEPECRIVSCGEGERGEAGERSYSAEAPSSAATRNTEATARGQVYTNSTQTDTEAAVTIYYYSHSPSDTTYTAWLSFKRQ